MHTAYEAEMRMLNHHSVQTGALRTPDFMIDRSPSGQTLTDRTLITYFIDR